MNKFLKVIGIGLIFAGAVLILKFVVGGNEDTWICRNGEWVKHGNPSAPSPSIPCEIEGQKIEELQATNFPKKVSFEESQMIAEGFAGNSSTYKFDGMGLKLESSETLKCPLCWDFVFSFQSRQAGYGNRKGQIMVQVITPHTLRVTVEKGEVAAAVVDGTYDELSGKFLK